VKKVTSIQVKFWKNWTWFAGRFSPCKSTTIHFYSKGMVVVAGITELPVVLTCYT